MSQTLVTVGTYWALSKRGSRRCISSPSEFGFIRLSGEWFESDVRLSVVGHVSYVPAGAFAYDSR